MALHVDRSMALSPHEFFPPQAQKTGICLHHTVGGTASSTVQHWKTDDAHVGTAYMIERDGTIFEIFDPKAWAWQFGLKGWGDARVPFEKRFIGIEIASEGGLVENEGKLYCFDRIHDRTWFSWDNAFDCGKGFRGYRYFARYKNAQVDAVIRLVNHLCETFPIPRRMPKNYLAYYGTDLRDFQGVIGHIHVRKDKSDPIPDDRFWHRVIAECSLETVAIGTEVEAPLVAPATAPAADLEALWENNVHQIVQMHLMAGSMVKQVLLELKKRDTYIRLRDAHGHTVSYDMVEGDPNLVIGLAMALGAFAEATASKLVVHS